MKLNEFRARIGGLLAAAVCALGLVVPVSIATTGTPAYAGPCDAIPSGDSFEIPFGCTNAYVSGVHRCQQVSYFNGAQAVECANIYATNVSGHQDVRGVGEFYCQGTYTQCLGMNVAVDMSYRSESSVNASTVTPVTYKCNPNPGPVCPNGHVKVWTGAGSPLPGNPADLQDPDKCVYTYSWIPYDTWHGYPNVMAVMPSAPGEHENTELDSIRAKICFA